MMNNTGYHNIVIHTGHVWFKQRRIDLFRLPKDVKTWVACNKEMDNSYEELYDM